MVKKLLFPFAVVLRHLRNKFFLGLLVAVPLIATIWILGWTFDTVDNLLQPIVRTTWGKTYPGIGVGIVLIFVYVSGLLASSILGNRIIAFFEKGLQKIPIFKHIYRGIKQIIASFTEPRQTGFMQVVFVEYPRKGMHAIGFITNELHSESEATLYTVFIPSSPNPTSGYMEIVREEELIKTDISVEDALKVVVSAGRVPVDTRDLLRNYYHKH